MENINSKQQHSYYYSLINLNTSINEYIDSLFKWLSTTSKLKTGGYSMQVQESERYIQKTLSNLIQIHRIIINKIYMYQDYFGYQVEFPSLHRLAHNVPLSWDPWIIHQSILKDKNIGLFHLKKTDYYFPKIKTTEINPIKPWLNSSIFANDKFPYEGS